MRVLIVEDDFGSRRYMQALFRGQPTADVVVDGNEAVDAIQLAWVEKIPYDLVLMDIMMPNKDGHAALQDVRAFEASIGVHFDDRVRVIMTTALEDPRNVVNAYYNGQADAYLVKPIQKDKLYETIRQLGLTV